MAQRKPVSASKKNTAAGKAKTQNRKTTGRQQAGTRNNSQAKARAAERETSTASVVTSVAVGLLFALILELSNFDILGTFGSWVKTGQFGLFGAMAYIFPLLVLFLFIVSTFDESRKRLVLSSVFLFIFACALSHLVSSISLEDHNVLHYFTECARLQAGGGILGGTIALGLYLLLSQTGAVVIAILIILICLFFLFEEPVRDLFAYIFYREPEEEPERPVKPVKPVKQKRKPEPQLVDYDRYEEELEQRQRYNRPVSKARVRSKQYDEPIYVTEDEEGTVIRIFKTRHKHGREHNITLTRTNKRATPLRDGTADPIQSEKVRGISNELDMMPHNAGGDEIHEITRKSGGSSRSRAQKQMSRDFFQDTVIPPQEETRWENTAPVRKTQEVSPEPPAEEKKPVRTRSSRVAAPEKTPAVSQTAPKPQAEKPKASREHRSSVSKVAPVPSFINGKSNAYFAPPLELLAPVKSNNKSSEAELERIAQNLEVILEQFGVNATVTDIQAGPSVTRFELQPEIGTRVNKITSLADDLKLNLGVTEIRIEAPIPGRQAVGIEIPNKNRQTVYMRELLEEPALINHSSKIAFAAGKDISGNVVVADIAKMPHLLVAGTTGSGKSVFLNTILMTILYRSSPADVGLIIIDPKKVEFGVYAGIPHLMKEVVTDPGQAVSTLRWAVNEMTNRYQRMQLSSVRDFKSYNAKVEKGTVSEQEENPRKMNQIVIIIDELADLMMVAKKEAEALICRLAQLARAAGIHLIIATQRPSVDVVTGLIKANVPARVALLVSSQIDSRTIIDMPGAEKLLGNGDMLFYPTGYVKPVRIQGAFVSDDEIQATVDYLIQNNKTDYFAAEAQEIEKFMNQESQDGSSPSGQDSGSDASSKYDDCFYEAGKMCIEMGKASSSMLQRRFNLGFNRAARIIDQLEEFGAVGPQNGAKPREILVDSMTFEEMYQAMMNSEHGA